MKLIMRSLKTSLQTPAGDNLFTNLDLAVKVALTRLRVKPLALVCVTLLLRQAGA